MVLEVQMNIERRRIATIKRLVKQLQELTRLRDQVRQAALAARGRTGRQTTRAPK